MCKKYIVFNGDNYNFIISNIILSQTNDFTYEDIFKELENRFGNVTTEVENVLKKCLIRLRDDGFLSILGRNYSVIEINI